MKAPFCIACGHKKNNVFFQWQEANSRKSSMLNCKNCGLLFKYPLPDLETLRNDYEEDYFKDYQKYYADFRTRQYRFYLDLLDSILQAKGRLLDIGCAFGFFLQAARKKGWDAEGFDISVFAKQQAKELYAIDITQAGSLNDAPFKAEYFDVITMWDVLEHDADPNGMLAAAGELLKPEGLAIIKVPNAEELLMKAVYFIYKLTGEKLITIGPRFEHHLYLFSKKSIRALLRECGFKVLKLIMDTENIVIDDRHTLDSMIKTSARRLLKGIETLFPEHRSSIVVIAQKA